MASADIGRHVPAGASPDGVLDMGGTIWEWCQNKFETPKTTLSAADDFDLRVVRGGAWGYRLDFARCAARFRRSPISKRRLWDFVLFVRPNHEH